MAGNKTEPITKIPVSEKLKISDDLDCLNQRSNSAVVHLDIVSTMHCAACDSMSAPLQASKLYRDF